MTFTVSPVVALTLLIISVGMAVIHGGWANPLVWIGWAFSVNLIVAPLIGE